MSRRHQRGSRTRIQALAVGSVAAMAICGSASMARADLIVQVLDSTTAAGGTGSFDVILQETNNGPDAVNSHTIQLSIPSGMGVSFTGANTGTDPTNEPYIYGSDQSPPFTIFPFPNTSFSATDTFTNAPFETVMNQGDIFGAAHVTYSVAPGTPSESLTVTLGSGTNVDDISSGPIPLTLTNGKITVIGSSSTVPVLSLTSSAPTGFGNQITNGASAPDKGQFTGPGAASNKLTVTGSSGSYTVAQVTGIGTGGTGDAKNYVELSGFSPSTDKEVIGLDIEVNGVQASPSQLTTLLGEINNFSGGLTSGLSASTTLANDPFPAKYNLFFTASPGVAADDFFGFNLSQANDSALVGYSVSAVAVVPEPVSLGLLFIGGIGLMARRSRRAEK